MPDMCKHIFEGLWVKIGSVCEGALPPCQHFLNSSTFASNLCLHISGIIHTLMQHLIEFTIFLWDYEAKNFEILVLTFKITPEQAKMPSKEPNLIRNSVVHADWILQISCKMKKFLRRNFIFSWRYIQEYVSDLDEKWMVREVDIWSFRVILLKNDGLVVKGLRT